MPILICLSYFVYLYFYVKREKNLYLKCFMGTVIMGTVIMGIVIMGTVIMGNVMRRAGVHSLLGNCRQHMYVLWQKVLCTAGSMPAQEWNMCRLGLCQVCSSPEEVASAMKF